MANINLLVTNATNYFTSADIALIESAAASAESFISSHFSFDYPVDLIVTGPSYILNTIPEDGITGRTYHSRFIIVVIDKAQKPISEASIFETICHELSHSLRWEKLPEHSSNLFEGMILEGLAIVLEEKAIKEQGIAEPQFFLKTIMQTTEAEYQELIKELTPLYETSNYDYETIFFTGNETLPRWAGYRLGYYYVKQCLKTTGRTIEQTTLDSYKRFSFK